MSDVLALVSLLMIGVGLGWYIHPGVGLCATGVLVFGGIAYARLTGRG